MKKLLVFLSFFVVIAVSNAASPENLKKEEISLKGKEYSFFTTAQFHPLIGVVTFNDSTFVVVPKKGRSFDGKYKILTKGESVSLYMWYKSGARINFEAVIEDGKINFLRTYNKNEFLVLKN